MRASLLALFLITGCDQAAAPAGAGQGTHQSDRSSDTVEARLRQLEAEDQRIMNALRSEQNAVKALSDTDQVLANDINSTRQAYNEHLNSHGE